MPNQKKTKAAKKDVDSDDERNAQKRRDDKKAADALKQQLAGKKGPVNLGGQGIKKSGSEYWDFLGRWRGRSGFPGVDPLGVRRQNLRPWTRLMCLGVGSRTYADKMILEK